MPVPGSYTEETLADYMHALLGPLAIQLELTSPDSYHEAVNETLLEYGADDISKITGRENIRRLRALARVELWRMVVNITAGDHDLREGDASFSRSQVHKQALENLRRAQVEALEFSGAYNVTVQKIHFTEDPYRVRKT